MFGWLRSPVVWAAAEAPDRLRQGNIPDRVCIRGRLDLANSDWLTYLPRELEVTRIDVSDCRNLRGLPERLKCEALILRRTNVVCLPERIDVSRRIDARDCRLLERLPPFCIPRLDLSGCASLEQLPDGLAVRRLEVARCSRLAGLPASIVAHVEHLDLSFCTGLTSLPEGFMRLETLSVRGCTNLTELPVGIRIRSAIDVADSGLKSLPWSLRSMRPLWRGVPVPDYVAFAPETITVEDILTETNTTMRRILLDRVGMEWFLDRAQATIVDRDIDTGGERRLLRIPFPSGEDVVCIEVRCPSTGNRYVLRVPLRISKCAEAAAWLAGYTSPADYRPIVET